MQEDWPFWGQRWSWSWSGCWCSGIEIDFTRTKNLLFKSETVDSLYIIPNSRNLQLQIWQKNSEHRQPPDDSFLNPWLAWYHRLLWYTPNSHTFFQPHQHIPAASLQTVGNTGCRTDWYVHTVCQGKGCCLGSSNKKTRLFQTLLDFFIVDFIIIPKFFVQGTTDCFNYWIYHLPSPPKYFLILFSSTFGAILCNSCSDMVIINWPLTHPEWLAVLCPYST